ncbi:MAG: tetratricopeptide repeat protein [Chloroflexi bacterium]|nr:tetratricopeptide repeat protein [Chloroflexota bacterium]
MTQQKRAWQSIGWPEALALVLVGLVVALVLTGQIDGIALIILLVVGYLGWMARGVIEEAQRVRPVEPPRTWAITMIANLALMTLGMGAFGWYIAGGGSAAWIPLLLFVAGMVALRQWRRGVVAKLYAWRGPALVLLQHGEYRKLVNALEDEATAGQGHPDKLAVVALAYIELNKWQRADRLLMQAKALAPDYASVNGALGSLRRHQARYAEAIEAIEAALRFDDNATSRYYLGLCQYLAGKIEAAEVTLQNVVDIPTLFRLGQVYAAFILGQIADERGDTAAAQVWYARMAKHAPKAIPALQEEARRHKQTDYGETLKAHTRTMEQILARRPLQAPDEAR